MITYLLEKYCLQPEVSSFIGDSEDDAIASMITGIPFYAVDYGYGGIYDSSCYDKTVLHSIGGILEYLK